jgi:nucleoside 2-deoxyribosyltransferase
MKVYLAARFSRLPEVVAYAAELEAEGIEVTSRWLRGGHEWVGTADEEIPVERNALFAKEDLDDIEAADMVVCFTESPRSGPARGGRHVEFGYALARGMNILVVGYRENVFYCLPDVDFAPDWRSAKRFLLRWSMQRLVPAGVQS